MSSRTTEHMERLSKVVADAIDRQFEETVGALKLSSTLIPFDQFPEADLHDAVGIPYRQFRAVNAVALVDSAGDLLARPYYRSVAGAEQNGDSARQALTPAEVSRFLDHVQLREAIRNEHAFSAPYFCERTRSDRLALSVAFPVREGTDSWILAVELSLAAVDRRLTAVTPHPGRAVVVDTTGRVLSHAMDRTTIPNRPIITKGFASNRPVAAVYVADGTKMMGVFAPIPFLGWGLVIEQPAASALQSVHRIRNNTLLWTGLGIIVAILGGLLLGRGIGRPIMELSDKAKQLAAGMFDHKIAVKSSDELGQLASSFNNMSTQLERRIEQLENLFNSSTRTLVAAVEAKDRYTAGHSERVTAYALVLSDIIRLNARDRSIVEISGLLHDVGKIGVPESILNKSGSLETREFDVIKYHPLQGYDIVRKIDHPYAEEVAVAVRSHHERWDGRGYPDGIPGPELSVVARILSIADAFDAMTSSRAYRKGMPPEVAISRLEEGAGTQFDAGLVERFSRAYEDGLLDDIFNSAKTVPPLRPSDDEAETEVCPTVEPLRRVSP